MVTLSRGQITRVAHFVDDVVVQRHKDTDGLFDRLMRNSNNRWAALTNASTSAIRRARSAVGVIFALFAIL